MLTDRQKQILRIIVEEYIKSAEPIGSRRISRLEEIDLSSATIRNVMLDLEELGFLDKPHTSAGRVPSQKGYRYFVDNLLELKLGNADFDLQVLEKLLAEQSIKFEETIQTAANIISQISNYTAVILGPEIFHTTLRQVELVNLSERKAVVVVITGTGLVESKVITLPEGIEFSELEQVVNLLNYRLKGEYIYKIKQRLYEEISIELKNFTNRLDKVQNFIQLLFSERNENNIFIGGTSNIFQQPEFRDIEKAKDLFHIFEHTDQLKRLIQSDDPGITIRIGEENLLTGVNDVSVISTKYDFFGQKFGIISVIGPKRMDYERVIRLLLTISKDFSLLLEKILNSK